MQMTLWNEDRRKAVEEWFTSFPMLTALSDREIARRVFYPEYARTRDVSKFDVKLVQSVRKTLTPWHDEGGWADWITHEEQRKPCKQCHRLFGGVHEICGDCIEARTLEYQEQAND